MPSQESLSFGHRIKRGWAELVHSVDAWRGWPSLRKAALVGEIDNKIFVDGADIDDPKIGKSRAFPMAQEIVVDKERSAPAGVGKKVDGVFFRDSPKLVFNVAFSCADSNPFFPGAYGDPTSIWFNVFFGYYEIDVAQRAWGRPFGYENDEKTIRWDDILKIGKSDWNYFSNWVYGVPDKYIRPTNDIADPLTKRTFHGRVPVGAKKFDLMEVNHAQVVTAYTAKNGAQLVDEDLIFSPAWRIAFGKPHPRPEFKESFFPARMTAKLYMCFDKKHDDVDFGEPVYRTFLFGGTINEDWAKTPEQKAENARFLDLQMKAVEKVMTKSYKDLGF
jgi:hypothetical protein